MVNQVFLIGRLGKDPAVRFTPSGTAVAQFSMATSDKFTKKDGSKEEQTQWHQVVAWGKLGEVCGEYLTGGAMVCIIGKVTYRTYEDKSGVKKYITEIVAREMKMLGGGKPKEQQQQAQTSPPEQDSSDIPF
jgi:single-strand DNA-binding protein